MGKAKYQNPFGGAPRIGNAAPGEPLNTPATDGVSGYGGGPVFNGYANRGAEAVSPSPASEIHPTPYGGGKPLVNRPNAKPASGSGDGTGGGATSGTTVP